jgi:hypothetical protein
MIVLCIEIIIVELILRLNLILLNLIKSYDVISETGRFLYSWGYKME